MWRIGLDCCGTAPNGAASERVTRATMAMVVRFTAVSLSPRLQLFREVLAVNDVT